VKLASNAIALIVVAGSRIAFAQALPYPSGALSMTSVDAMPGVGRDWQRFGSGLEEDLPVVTKVRWVSSAEDSHPIIWLERFGSGLEDDAPVSSLLPSGVRFGSGLEDDAPGYRPNVLNQPGF
jgi:hypothetical protein